MKKGPQELQDKLLSLKNAANRSLFELNTAQKLSVTLLPDKSVSPGKFLPSKITPKCYYAHPDTMNALRKDIFAAGNDLFEDLEELILCPSCHKQLDLQFWSHCPFCTFSLANLGNEM